MNPLARLLPTAGMLAVMTLCAVPDPRAQAGEIGSDLIQKTAQRNFPEFFELLSMPNDAIVPADIQRNADWLESAFRKRGFATRQLPNGGKPLVFAEYERKAANAKTVLFYMHFDGQPVVPDSMGPEEPVEPGAQEAPCGRGPGAACDPHACAQQRCAPVGGDRREQAAGGGDRPGVADLRARLVRRQGPDHDVPHRLRRAQGGGGRAGHQRQSPARRRGREGLPDHRRGHQAAPRTSAGGRHRDQRRSDAREQPPHHHLRQSRQHDREAHRSWAAQQPAQRALRELCAQSGAAARGPPRLHEGRRRARHHCGLLRRREADRRGACQSWPPFPTTRRS